MSLSVLVSRRVQVGCIALLAAGLGLSQRNQSEAIPPRLAAGGAVAVSNNADGVQISEDGQVTANLAASPRERAFGRTLATDGATVAVGAEGSVFLYSKQQSIWTRTGSLRAAGVESAAIGNGTLVLGRPGEAEVFVLENGEWTPQCTFG